MLSKKSRLSGSTRIRALLSKGELYQTPHLTFRYEKSDADFSQFAVVVSTKISKKAVDRNRIKRQILEAVRLHMDHIPYSIQAVIIARKLELDYKDIEHSVQTFIKSL